MSEAIAPKSQADRISAAVDSALSIGPGFLRGEVDADTMANTMVAAVHGYVDAEKADGRDGSPVDARSAELFPVLQELITCGGGYLAGRCDSDCVARTMTQLVAEFGAAN
jgi:hypothetical protein